MTKPPLPELTAYSKISLDDFKQFLIRQRYSSNTVRSYVDCLAIFIKWQQNKPLKDITLDDIHRFNDDYILVNSYSSSFQNQVLNALKCYFKNELNTNFDTSEFKRPIREHRLPVVLNLDEVERIMNVTTNLKHLSMLVLIYSSGLRSGELLNLKISDIDSKRMTIHIKAAKGKKDRIVPLADSTLQLLRKYYLKYRPKEFLFNGDSKLQYSRSSLQAIFRKACERASIRKRVTLHSLRHSYATHLLEGGINLRYIQEILGHNSPRTTQIYTLVTTDEVRKVVSPIEKISLNKLNEDGNES